MTHYFSQRTIFCFLYLLIIFLMPINTLAQSRDCNIIGKIVDETQEPISYASVAIFNGTTPIAGVITDEKGNFAITTKQSNNEYSLVVNFIGYEKAQQSFTANNNKIDIGIITLKNATVALDEIVVSANETATKSTVEHTTINASSFISSSKGSAIDVLRSSSNINIINNDVSIRGNSNILILFDGIPTTISDLSTIPASTIKSIEVITNPDASHDASGTGGIINIISQKSKNEGVSGMITSNYGFNHFSTGNIIISYNTPKNSWRMNYSTKYDDDVINTTLNRVISATSLQTFQQIHATKTTFNNNIALGTDIRINPRNRLSIDVKCILPRQNIEQKLHNTFISKDANYEEFRFNDVTWNRENLEASIAYFNILKPEISEISIKTSISKIWGHRPSYYYLDNEPINRSKSGGSPLIQSIQADYSHKLNNGVFSSGVKISYRQNDIYHKFYTMKNGEWDYSSDMSNDLLHTELIPAAYAMYSSLIGKNISYKVGLRGELSSVSLKSTFNNVDKRNNSFFLSPTLSISYSAQKNQELSLALSRRIGRPTYPQLNPYMSMVDATTFEQGNMYLKPEKSTKLDLCYSLKNEYIHFFTDAYLNHTKDYISQITTISNDKLITTYINADSDIKTGLDISLKFIPLKWLNVSLNANTFYVYTDGEYNGVNIMNFGWANNSNLLLNIMPWKGADIQVQYFITTPQHYPQLTTAHTHQMNIGIKQRLLKDKMSLSVLVTDIFDSYKWEIYSHNNLFDISNISKNKSRMLWLGISYNFNSFKQKLNKTTETDRTLIKLGL